MPKKRRRRLFGATVEAMGPAGRATPVGTNPERIVERREQQDKSKRLLTGGRNKGEEKGYGATAPSYDPRHGAAPR